MPIDQMLLNRLKGNDSTLTELNLSYQDLATQDLQALVQALNTNTTLTTLYVYGNQIGVEGAKALATNTTLTTLHVGNNQIGVEGAKALATNATLTTLDVHDNQIGDEGAKALATNTTLTTLHVGNNRIGDEGAKALATNATLTTLHVDSNRIGDEGAKALATNTTLTTLHVYDNRIGDEGAKALATNTTLTTLHVSHNRIGDEGAKALATNATLTILQVDSNRIGDEGAKALATNTTLTTLHVGNNPIGVDWEQALARRMAHNQQQVVKRRDLFIQAILTLARDSANRSSRSTWQALPKDIQLYLLSFIHFASLESIGKTPQQVYHCIQFIFTHLSELNESLQTAITTDQGLKVMEKIVVKTSQFRFFPAKPPLLASANQLNQQAIIESPDTIEKRIKLFL